MPTTYSSRVMVCVGTLLVALFLIFGIPNKTWFDPNTPIIQKTNLKPGIDMVGGVRLIYAIQAPPGSNIPDLANKVMDSLKERVDPNGLLNLVWRPQGQTRLEIQMPLSPEAAKAPEIKKRFDSAKRELDASNITQQAVISAVEQSNGADQTKELSTLAWDSQTRKTLFANLVADYNEIQALTANPDHLSDLDLALKLAPIKDDYEKLKGQIESTNLTSYQYQQVLEEADAPKTADQGRQKLDGYKKEYADFPSRLKAIAGMDQEFKEYDTVKSAISGADELKHLLQGSGVLEFHILADGVTADPAELKVMKARLGADGKGPLPQPGDHIRWMEVEKKEEFDKAGSPPETTEWNGKYYLPVLITAQASMDKTSGQWGLVNAGPSQDSSGGRAVSFKFDSAGGKLFGDLTTYWHDLADKKGSDAHSRLAIVLDGKLISAPNLQSAITGGSGEITGGGAGGFKEQDQEYLIDTLNAGSLPAQLSSEPISEEQVGSTLGADNLRKGLIACAFGLVVVAVFLISYYYLAGMVAFIAVAMNVILILGVMCGLAATFTLPSIAGIVLTIGTAVDANVLIFERLREEQHKGLPLRMALRNSYAQAQSAIVDSNMTSAITSFFLYVFGSEEVKGFGLTLLIGIVASLFTALYVTKTIFGILIDHYGLKDLTSLPRTFPKWDKALRPNWDWMGKAWIFYTFSVIMITWGMILFVVKAREGKMMDIEFATGTSIQVALKNPMSIGDVRKLVDEASVKYPTDFPSPSVVAVGREDREYEIVSPQVDRSRVHDAVLGALKNYLSVELPSTYDNIHSDYGEALNKSVLPITDAKFSVDGFIPPGAADRVGGVAVVLRNITPPMTVDAIKSRLSNEQASSSVQTIGSIESEVDAPGDPSKPTSFAVIIGSNTTVSYNADQGAWAEDLASPLWKMSGEALNHPPQFEKETNIDPQVAGETQQSALLALAFSIAAIMVYIWIRFGNMKYATATVVALLHDTVFTIAGLGFAQYIYQYWPGNFLQIEPFRINLTVVAGILTIMGYSMIDTIVVFDRIRENRGKYGHLNKQVINDAINQTLSRTLLTCGTTIVTVSFMYFLGGAGIHGFTFVLLVGILVGTYSSVAIAAPMLLWGKEKQPGGHGVPAIIPRAKAIGA